VQLSRLDGGGGVRGAFPVSGATRGWATCTNARLRAAQGDVAGARRILATVLGREPGNTEAERLHRDLIGRADEDARPAADAEAPGAPVPGDARAERDRFRAALGPSSAEERLRRIDRLERWLDRIGDDPNSVLFVRDAG